MHYGIRIRIISINLQNFEERGAFGQLEKRQLLSLMSDV